MISGKIVVMVITIVKYMLFPKPQLDLFEPAAFDPRHGQRYWSAFMIASGDPVTKEPRHGGRGFVYVSALQNDGLYGIVV